jgi:type IV secretion system protein VirB9
MKRLCLIGCLWLLANARAQEAGPPAAQLGGQNLPLGPQEAAGVSITRQWQDRSLEAMQAQPGPDGAVVFTYGQSMPSIVGAILKVTDIKLQEGEALVAPPFCGDDRWHVEPTPAADAEGTPLIQHIILKPTESGLKTSLVLVTNRRSYHLQLVSTDKDYMAYVAFSYPDAPKAAARVETSQGPETPSPEQAPRVQVAMQGPTRAKNRTARKSAGKAAVFLDKAEAKDHDFRIQGSAPFRPTQVYTDGKKTYIELPENLQEAPVLFRLKKGGFLGLGHQMQVVNHRVHGHWVVADAVLDKAVLVSGVGSAQQKVTLSRIPSK